MTIEVNAKGPIFDGRAAALMPVLADDIGEAVANQGVNVVRGQFASVVQHPTGRYSRSLHAVHAGSRHTVTDGGMVYGPWLAGVGSKNKTSRFKGYAHWRRSVQVLRRRVKSIAAPIVARYRGRL